MYPEKIEWRVLNKYYLCRHVYHGFSIIHLSQHQVRRRGNEPRRKQCLCAKQKWGSWTLGKVVQEVLYRAIDWDLLAFVCRFVSGLNDESFCHSVSFCIPVFLLSACLHACICIAFVCLTVFFLSVYLFFFWLSIYIYRFIYMSVRPSVKAEVERFKNKVRLLKYTLQMIWQQFHFCICLSSNEN